MDFFGHFYSEFWYSCKAALRQTWTFSFRFMSVEQVIDNDDKENLPDII